MNLPSQDTADHTLGDPADLDPGPFDIPPGDVKDLWL